MAPCCVACGLGGAESVLLGSVAPRGSVRMGSGGDRVTAVQAAVQVGYADGPGRSPRPSDGRSVAEQAMYVLAVDYQGASPVSGGPVHRKVILVYSLRPPYALRYDRSLCLVSPQGVRCTISGCRNKLTRLIR